MKTKETKKEMWRKDFVEGNQNTVFVDSIMDDGRVEDVERRFYYSHNLVFNRIKSILSNFNLLDEKDLYVDGGIVDQMIPFQVSYNKIKNCILDIVDRITYPTVIAEDGSVDMEELADCGLEIGKVLVHRVGSIQPTINNFDYSSTIEALEKELDDIYNAMYSICQHYYNLKNQSVEWRR